MFIGIVGAVLLVGAAWLVVRALANDKDENAGASLYTVQRGDMLITVTDDGNVESASNVDIKCELMGGGTILSIVQDGKLVEAGEELFRLDTSTIENDLTLQKSTFEKATATKIQSEQNLSAADIAVKQYKEGTHVQALQTADQAITIAQQNLTSSRNNLEFTEKMVRKGFATPLQKESDEFAVKRAELELATAETAKRVLVEFTYDKEVRALEAARDTAAAQFRADTATLKNEEDKLKKLEKQLAACVVNAPSNGMVVYANENRNRFGSSTPTIEEGAQVRQGQTIIKLPDLSKMQVVMTVHESKIDQIKPGMPARIVIQGKDYKGAVVSIKNQPEPQGFMAANVKEYATTVAIQGESEGLRPGMTAQVDILLDEVKNAVTVPVSCVVQQGAKFYCWVQNGSKYERRELKIGRTNDKDIEIIDGIKEGNVVLRNPRAMKAEAREEVPAPEGTQDATQFGAPATPSQDGGFGSGGPRQGGPGRGGPDGAGAGPGGNGQGGPGGGGRRGGGFNLMQFDTDGDKKISRDEAPDRMKEGFDGLDTNGDGFIDAAEIAAMRARFSGGGGPRGGGGPEGGRGGPGGSP